MSESELSRLRQDVQTIQEAAGLTLPFGWRDVWLSLGLVPCGLMILLWAALGPWEYIAVSLAPLLLFAIVILCFEAAAYLAGGARGVKLDGISTGVIVVAFALLILWEKWLSLPAKPVRGAAFIIAGMMCIVISLQTRQRRVTLAAAAALIPFGIALPLCSQQSIALIGGVAVAVTGATAAAILAGQLRAEQVLH